MTVVAAAQAQAQDAYRCQALLPQGGQSFPCLSCLASRGAKEASVTEALACCSFRPMNGSSCSSFHFLFCQTPCSVTLGVPHHSLGSLQSLFMGSCLVVPCVFLLLFLLCEIRVMQPRLTVDPGTSSRFKF